MTLQAAGIGPHGRRGFQPRVPVRRRCKRLESDRRSGRFYNPSLREVLTGAPELEGVIVNDRAYDYLLLKAIRAGDVTAFETLYQRFSPGLLGFIMQRVPNRPVAEELLQETFIRLLRDGRFEPNRASLGTYLYIIARNLTLNYIRDRGTRRQSLIERTAGKSEEAMWGHTPVEPDEQVERREQIEQLQSALDELPEAQREAFVLRHHHGRSYQEIASIADIPVGTAKSRVHLAVAALRNSLTKPAEEATVIPLRARQV